MKLAEKFVPAADEVYRLQTGNDPECKFFQKIAQQGHAGGRPGTSQQGTFALTPSGVLLASINSNDRNEIVRLLERALAKWEKLPREERLPAKDPKELTTDIKRPERFYPKDGLVLHVHSRDLPRDPPLNGRWAQAWNQDYAWFTNKEQRQFLPDKLEVGQKQDLPRVMVHRIVCAHLVDNVRGETGPAYRESEVKKARLTAEVTEVKDGIVSLRLEGESKTAAEGEWKRGIETRLLGKATYDVKKERFVTFELVAVGTRYGATRFNVRNNDPGPAPIGFMLTLAGDTSAEKVAPALRDCSAYRPVFPGRN